MSQKLLAIQAEFRINLTLQQYIGELTSTDGVIPFSSSLTFALRISPNLSCRCTGNLKVLEFSTSALETPWPRKETCWNLLEQMQKEEYNSINLHLSKSLLVKKLDNTRGRP